MASTGASSGTAKNSGSTRRGSTRSGSTRSQSSNRQAASSARRSQSTRRRSSGRSSSRNGSSAKPVEAVRGTVSSGAHNIASGAQSTGQAIGSAAGKAKGPALTGGAALAGLVGGMVIATRGGRRKVLGMPIPGTRRPLVKIKTPRRNHVAKDVVKAAGQVGSAGRQMAELATEVRLARQQLDGGRRRSPIAVVLEGLTARRGRAG
jgi:hypothetical protein